MLIHAHQIEVQEFEFYALIIDARSPAEYAQDHIPGAVNLPAVLAHGSCTASSLLTHADVGQPWLGVSEAGIDPLRYRTGDLQPGAMVLVYCSRGGLDAQVWEEPLRQLGFCVDILGGGWPNYLRWVENGLRLLLEVMTLRCVQAAPMGGLDPVIGSLARMGQQVLQLDWVGVASPSPQQALPARRTVSQPAFEARLFHAIRTFDPERPVWVGRCWPEMPPLRLPAAVADAVARQPWLIIDMPARARVSAWRGWLEVRAQRGISPVESMSAVWRGLRDAGLEAPERLQPTQLEDGPTSQCEDLADQLAQSLGLLAPIPEHARRFTIHLASGAAEDVEEAVAECVAVAALQAL